MRKSLILFSAIVAVASAGATSIYAQNLLDQQLGGPPAAQSVTPETSAPVAPPAAAPAATPDPVAPREATPAAQPDTPRDSAAAPAPVGGSDIVSPDAVKKVDDADLINKLTRTEEAPKAPPVAQQMSDMIDRMGESEKRLTGKDPGDVTQETQRRILTDLDVLIEYARQQQSGPGKPQPGDPQQGQQRSYSQNQQNQGGTTAANSSFLPGGNAATPSFNDDIHSRGPNEWGGLRPRERDLISHGANEEYLSAYRDMIDRYYQALAELGKSHSH